MKKVVTGVAVGALIVAGAVGILVAQENTTVTHPWASGANSLDVVYGDGRTQVSLDATVEVSNLAALVAWPNNTDSKTPIEAVVRVDSVDNADDLGNIGYLIAETDLKDWDIVVSLVNGGRLVRPPIGDEPLDVVSDESYGPWRDTLVSVPGSPWGESIQIRDTTAARYAKGIALKWKQYKDKGITPAPKLAYIPLRVGIGIVNPTIFANPSVATVPSQIRTYAATTPNDWVNTGGTVGPITIDAFVNPDGDEVDVSLADAIGLKLKTASGASDFTVNSFGYDGTTMIGEAEDVGFSDIVVGPNLRVFQQINGLAAEHPSRNAKSVVFTVTGGLGLYATDDQVTSQATNGHTVADGTTPISAVGDQMGTLSGNKAGNYTETVTFTFWGLY